MGGGSKKATGDLGNTFSVKGYWWKAARRWGRSESAVRKWRMWGRPQVWEIWKKMKEINKTVLWGGFRVKKKSWFFCLVLIYFWREETCAHLKTGGRYADGRKYTKATRETGASVHARVQRSWEGWARITGLPDRTFHGEENVPYLCCSIEATSPAWPMNTWRAPREADELNF